MFCSIRLLALITSERLPKQNAALHALASRGILPDAHGAKALSSNCQVPDSGPRNPYPPLGCLSAGRLKDLGNQAFKAGQNRFAKPKWERAIRLMDRLLDAETEEQVGLQRLGVQAVRPLLGYGVQRMAEFGHMLPPGLPLAC